MSTELRVTLPGPEGSEDARHALKVLERVLILLGELEDVAAGKQRTEHSTWGFTGLALGSVCATLAPHSPRTGSTSETLDEVMRRAIDGFCQAEDQEGVPAGWDLDAASAGAELARLLPLMQPQGLKLELLDHERVVKEVVVTNRSAEHLRAGLRTRVVSIGSVIGRLDSASVHEGGEARVWPDGGGRRVEVRFDPKRIEEVRPAWGKRVEVTGQVERDAGGRIVRVRMRSIEILRDRPVPLADLFGLDRDFTGGLEPSDYLREIRGAA